MVLNVTSITLMITVMFQNKTSHKTCDFMDAFSYDKAKFKISQLKRKLFQRTQESHEAVDAIESYMPLTSVPRVRIC